MTKVGKILTDILRISIIPFIGIVVLSMFFMTNSAVKNLFSGYGVWMFVVGTLTLVIGVFAINSKLDIRDKYWSILGLGFIVRFLWIKFVPSVPVSDYATMYDCAGRILDGDFSGMHGTGYFARYPHLTISVLYMALMRLIFTESAIFYMRYVSIIASMINLILIFKISEYFFENIKSRLLCVLFAAVFPPFITYVSTLCTENLALPFLFAAILYYFKIINGKFTIKNAILCGVFLAISNMFRGVGLIIVIAMIIFALLRNCENKLKALSLIIASMIATIVLTSSILVLSNVSEVHLWKGKESSITYFLKGLNVDAKGAWNKDDATFVEENLLDEDFDEQCIDIIKSRLSEKTPSELTKFFFLKFAAQWSYGDCNGAYWAFMDTVRVYKFPCDAFSQIFATIMMLLAMISLFKRQGMCESILHIFMCGFGIFFLIFETQPRYVYIIYWIFIPLAVQGIETICDFIIKWRKK